MSCSNSTELHRNALILFENSTKEIGCVLLSLGRSRSRSRRRGRSRSRSKEEKKEEMKENDDMYKRSRRRNNQIQD